MQRNKFLLYGANGYTGRLIARRASGYGLQPILAGRNETALQTLAASLHLTYQVIDLANREQLRAALKEVPLVLHAAGPFQHTSLSMIEACLATGTHYLDITGEIFVFEQAKRFDAAAQEKNIMIMPGVGFDVVPTDCMALYLKEQLPDATHLKLAFAMVGGQLSHGTATTMAENMGERGVVRENGKMIRKPLGHKGFWVDFGIRKLFVMCIPWGDISTAYTTTGIPNIETYTRSSPKTFSLLKWQGLFNWFLRSSFARGWARKKIKQKPAGPSDEMRAKAMSLVWGEASNAEGKKVAARLICPEGYTLTALSSLIIVKKVLEGNFKAGYQTPAGAYGADLVMEINGVTREPLW
ncbi:MAG: saccharopine dehydrogenase NADP-binding domain-containing protein [Sediminibacterium sp.]|nr:saccharopine dehydrogenase NADP-binding domain-containing protein [Sediminibacterium sp.]MDP3127187.1 saccharopine dehydrogenase NADP-binding domain-containing protein [Sediminibacterium sp.]